MVLDGTIINYQLKRTNEETIPPRVMRAAKLCS